MTAQSCRTCDYFSLEDKPRGDGAGFCFWMIRNPIPDCVAKWEHDTEESAGETCPCWRSQGHIDAFLADRLASRTQENHQLETAIDKARASATRLGHVIAEYESFIRARRAQETP